MIENPRLFQMGPSPAPLAITGAGGRRVRTSAMWRDVASSQSPYILAAECVTNARIRSETLGAGLALTLVPRTSLGATPRGKLCEACCTNEPLRERKEPHPTSMGGGALAG